MDKVYTIGDTTVLLSEIAAITSVHKAKVNTVFLPIKLKSGIELMASIHANGENEIGLSNGLASDHFIRRYEKEVEQFINAFKEFNKI